MKKRSEGAVQINRRRFLQIVAVAGGTAALWKLGIFGPARQMQSARRSLPIMGTVMNLTVHGPDRDACEEAVNRTIATMQGLESMLSRHMTDSELAQLNRTGRLENPSPELLEVLAAAGQLFDKSGGAFDVTILPVLRLYETADGLPDRKVITLTESQVDWRHVTITPQAIRFTRPEMAISLDGIAKGYIVDQGTVTLRNLGFNDVYVEAGGDLMVSGLRDGHEPWRIGIRPPRTGQSQAPLTLRVSDRAVATSGDYLQAFSPDLRYHHILDPHTGISPAELASCTVTAPNVTLADGLATAIMVLGPDAGRDLIEPMHECEAYMVGKDLTEYATSGFWS